MEKWFKKLLALILGTALSLSLSACTIPKADFADYDVSAYIQALLDSSYYGQHEDLMRIASVTQEEAQQYNDTTVDNAAVIFCNTYEVSPSEEQLQELEVIMRQALCLCKYTVKDERKVESGYYLEVEIASISNFSGRSRDIETIKEAARLEATATGADANELFVNEVLEFCKRELANISYDQESCTVPLDIRLTEDGDLQLNMDQIETIDRTVIRLEK